MYSIIDKGVNMAARIKINDDSTQMKFTKKITFLKFDSDNEDDTLRRINNKTSA